MRQYLINKFYSKHTQKGMVFLYTIMLILIIAVLTIAFLHMQFQEVVLIAHETDSLQAFYLAQSGLNQGIRELSENLELIWAQIRDDPNIFCNQNIPNRLTTVNLDPITNKRGSYDYHFCLDDTQADNDVIIVNGTGMINNIKRIIQSRYIPPEGLPDRQAEDLARAVNGPTSLRLPNTQDVPVFGCDPESNIKIQTQERPLYRAKSSSDQLKPLDPNQIQAIDDFTRISKGKITMALRIDKNNNELLFFRNDIIAQNYNSPYMENIDSTQLGSRWKYPEFDYRDYRITQGSGNKKLTIIQPHMTLKRNQQITLKEGTHKEVPYFFISLTLEEDSTLTTEGYVQIFANRLELKDGARLIGEDKNPNKLLILVEYNEISPYISDIEDITIGASAEVYGHIFAPRLELHICAGRGVSRTRVQGFVLTRRLVTGRSPGAFGQVIICHDLNISDEIVELPGSWQEVWNL